MRNFGAYLLKHRSHAAFFALLCAVLPFIGLPTGWISAVIIALVTLRFGPKAGLYILMWVVLPAVVLAVKGDWWLAVQLFLFGNVLAWLLAYVLYEFKSWILVLQITALLGIAGILIVHAIIPHVDHWWIAKLGSYISGLNSDLNMGISLPHMHKLVLFLAKIATGMQAVLILFNGLVNLLFARWWQASMFNPGGLRRELSHLRMTKLANMVLLACLIAVALNANLAWDLLPVIALPFVVAGLSLLHTVCRRIKHGWFLLVMLYILLVFMFPYVVGLLVLAALIDSWYDFRMKYSLV